MIEWSGLEEVKLLEEVIEEWWEEVMEEVEEVELVELFNLNEEVQR